jgi:hypothetical protein
MLEPMMTQMGKGIAMQNILAKKVFVNSALVTIRQPIEKKYIPALFNVEY